MNHVYALVFNFYCSSKKSLFFSLFFSCACHPPKHGLLLGCSCGRYCWCFMCNFQFEISIFMKQSRILHYMYIWVCGNAIIMLLRKKSILYLRHKFPFACYFDFIVSSCLLRSNSIWCKQLLNQVYWHGMSCMLCFNVFSSNVLSSIISFNSKWRCRLHFHFSFSIFLLLYFVSSMGCDCFCYMVNVLRLWSTDFQLAIKILFNI